MSRFVSILGNLCTSKATAYQHLCEDIVYATYHWFCLAVKQGDAVHRTFCDKTFGQNASRVFTHSKIALITERRAAWQTNICRALKSRGVTNAGSLWINNSTSKCKDQYRIVAWHLIHPRNALWSNRCRRLFFAGRARASIVRGA